MDSAPRSRLRLRAPSRVSFWLGLMTVLLAASLLIPAAASSQVRGGILDRMVGGAGFRRGRRHPDQLRVGDAIDFWRVEAVEPNRLLRLRAEMKVPGRAWLQFDAVPQGDDGARSRLVQTAFFAPRGLFGLLYWYALYPLHAYIFSSMIRNIGRAAEARDAQLVEQA